MSSAFRFLGLVVPSRLVGVHHFLAWLGGYFWIECQKCGRCWGGHQRHGNNQDLCPRCERIRPRQRPILTINTEKDE